MAKTRKAKKPKEKLKRLNLNLDAETRRLFKTATASKDTDMTHAILKFVDDYIEKYAPEELVQQWKRRREK